MGLLRVLWKDSKCLVVFRCSLMCEEVGVGSSTSASGSLGAVGGFLTFSEPPLLACSAERSGRPVRVPSVRANSGFSRRWNVSNFGTRDRGLRTEGAHLLTEAVGPQAKQL